MKKNLILVTLLLIAISVFAQSPEKFSYQAVVRNASNDLVKNAPIGAKISILQGSATGAVVYEEVQTPTTNANGLMSIEVGIIQQDFSEINWANGPYFIKTEIDPSGGSNYTITGTSQLLSVPFALHAKSAESLSGGGHYVGELYGGGVVFWVDHTGKHGLIVSMVDVVSNTDGVFWSNITTASGGNSYWNGNGNSQAIVGQEGHTDSHAKRCLDYTNVDYGTGVFSDWYMPSFGEMIKLISNLHLVQKTLDEDGNESTVPFQQDRNLYTSTEFSGVRFFVFVGNSLAPASIGKGNSTGCTRAVRAF